MEKLCVLPRWQVEDLKENANEPDCRKHRHLKADEAQQLIAIGNLRWISGSQAEFVSERTWQVVHRWKFPQRQLLEK